MKTIGLFSKPNILLLACYLPVFMSLIRQKWLIRDTCLLLDSVRMSTIRQAVALCCPSASFVFHNPFGETKLFDFAILQLPNPFLCIPFAACVPHELAELRLRIVNPDADGSIVRNPVMYTDQVFAIALQEFLRSRVSGL